MNNLDILCAPLAPYMEPKLFKALSDQNRILLLAALARDGGEMNVTQAAKTVPVSFSQVSRHLAILQEAGVVAARKEGKRVWYRALIPKMAQGLRALADALEACCQENESKLETEETNEKK